MKAKTILFLIMMNKPNRATMRPSCALSRGNFGVVTGFIDRSLNYADAIMAVSYVNRSS